MCNGNFKNHNILVVYKQNTDRIKLSKIIYFHKKLVINNFLMKISQLYKYTSNQCFFLTINAFKIVFYSQISNIYDYWMIQHIIKAMMQKDYIAQLGKSAKKITVACTTTHYYGIKKGQTLLIPFFKGVITPHCTTLHHFTEHHWFNI